MRTADFLQESDAVICVAGKNDIAVSCLRHFLDLGVSPSRLCVVLNKDDVGKNTWQESLGFHAKKLGVPVCGLEQIKGNPELWFFSVEFDRILRPADFASRRLYNVHFSKLPAYRGVATSVWPILRSEAETGVTFHLIDEGVDTGPVIHQRSFAIGHDWTARDLYLRYMAEGFELFREALVMLRKGANGLPQDESKASLFRRRDLDFSKLVVDISRSAKEVGSQIRAYTFWEYQLPQIGGRKIWSARIIRQPASAAPGTLRATGRWYAALSAMDADLEIRFSPYDEFYEWSRSRESADFDLGAVPDLDLQDAQGWSAMMKAAYAGNVNAIRLLARAGASVTKCNRRGTTPLMYAFSYMNEKHDQAPFRLLLELGADPFVRDQHGRSLRDYVPESERNRLAKDFPDIFS